MINIYIRKSCADKFSRVGFTLTEVMITVLIVGILAGIAVPMFSKARKESRIRAATAELQMIHAAVVQLAWDTGKWPGAVARNIGSGSEIWDLSSEDAGILEADDDDFPGWKGPYMRTIEEDPWGNQYFFDPDYSIAGVDCVVVGSFGPNGVGQNVYDTDNIYITLK